MANGGIIGTVNNPTSSTATGVWQQEEQYEAVRDGTWPEKPLFTTKSCRFNDGDSANLYKTPSSTGNRRKFTFSTWLKRASAFGVQQVFFGSWNANSDAGYTSLRFTDADQLNLTGWNTNWFVTSRKFRDPSAWYHIVLSIDTENGTAGNRMRLYINGVEETSFSTNNNPSQNQDLSINVSGSEIYIASNEINGSKSNFLDGYLAETVLIDGQQLAADQFGEFDEDSGIWKPIDVSGLTFGTNGFYLDFEDSSNLGNDANGGTDLTATNLAATDQSTDTCTNNFCTMNPLDNFFAANTYSEGNTKFVTKASGGFAYGTSTIGLSSGKWYAEFDCIATTDSGAYHQVGIVEKPSSSATTSATANIGSTAYSWGYYADNGKSRNNGNYTNYGNSWTTGNIIGVYLNLDDNELKFSKDGAIQNSGTAISITASASNGTGHYFITAGGMSTNASVTFEANFGNPFQSQSSSVSDANGYGAFEYSPTLSGVNYYAINTKNLGEFG